MTSRFIQRPREGNHSITRLNRFIVKSPLQKLQCVLGYLPFNVLSVGSFCNLIADGILSVPADNGSIDIRIGSQVDIEALDFCFPKKKVYTRRFFLGDNCFTAWNANQIIGYMWFSIRPCCLEERFGYLIKIESDTVYVYDIFIRDEFRRLGILDSFYRAVEDWMDINSRQKIKLIIDYDNVISWKAHLSKGFYPTSRVVCLSFFGKCLFQVTKVHPQYLPPIVEKFLQEGAPIN